VHLRWISWARTAYSDSSMRTLCRIHQHRIHLRMRWASSKIKRKEQQQAYQSWRAALLIIWVAVALTIMFHLRQRYWSWMKGIFQSNPLRISEFENSDWHRSTQISLTLYAGMIQRNMSINNQGKAAYRQSTTATTFTVVIILVQLILERILLEVATTIILVTR